MINLQFNGCCDNEMSTLSGRELLAWALANGAMKEEGAYAVRHGWTPLRDLPNREHDHSERAWNFMAANFSYLFTHGVGGFEIARKVDVSFSEHVKWCLHFYDGRFAIHPSFMFVAFGVLQRRQVLNSARVQMKRKDFARNAQLIQSLCVEDLQRAAREEDEGLRISDERVRLLRRDIFATSSRVTGSDHSRLSRRNEIWAMCTFKCGPTGWRTWNMDDLNDPVVQVLCGETIDMDHFDPTAGADARRRARNVAQNPYAVAVAFNYLTKAVYEHILGIKKEGGKLTVEQGVLGRMSGYVASVETQGRGSLHSHGMDWFEGAPCYEDMAELLRDTSFRERMTRFVASNIRAHLPGMSSKEELEAIPRLSAVGYDRPPDPDSATFWNDMEKKERDVVRARQVHSCKKTTCLRYTRTGVLKCKRGAPFPLSDIDRVSRDGTWACKRTYGYLNNWNPTFASVLMFNHDYKLLLNGHATRNCTFYGSTYMSKKQGRSYNQSALIANTYAYHEKDERYVANIRERHRILIFQCINSLNKMQELSGQLVATYLLGLGDSFSSHNFVPLYWSSLAGALKRAHRDLRDGGGGRHGERTRRRVYW